MPVTPQNRHDALVLATNDATEALAVELVRRIGDRFAAAPALVGAPGEALRLIRRHGARLLLVCVAPDGMDASIALIETLHVRRARWPLVAVAAEHDAMTERAVRAAGVSFYCALDHLTGIHPLDDLLRSFQIGPKTAHSGLSPPRAGAQPIRPIGIERSSRIFPTTLSFHQLIEGETHETQHQIHRAHFHRNPGRF